MVTKVNYWIFTNLPWICLSNFSRKLPLPEWPFSEKSGKSYKWWTHKYLRITLVIIFAIFALKWRIQVLKCKFWDFSELRLFLILSLKLISSLKYIEVYFKDTPSQVRTGCTHSQEADFIIRILHFRDNQILFFILEMCLFCILFNLGPFLLDFLSGWIPR